LTFATPDDFFHSAEDLERQLEANAAEPWAPPLLAHFQPILDTAITEQQQASDALKAVQAAQLKREQVEGSARPLFVRFRRAVRSVFGRSSRQFRELLDKQGFGADDEDEPLPGGGGAAGGGGAGGGGAPPTA
jgi:hypothetical protein